MSIGVWRPLTLAIMASAGAQAAGALPRVEIAFPRLIERYCSEASPQPPDPAVLDEIARRLPEFVSAWEREGPGLLAEAERVVGHPYHFGETQAVLHGCEDLSSMSQPLLIAVARHTDAWADKAAPEGAARERRPLAEFVNSVWHETIHRYLGRIIAGLPGGTTPSRDRWRDESIVVRNHMHLFALEEVIYRRAGRDAEFQARRNRIIARGDPELARAHRIVIEEGAEALVAELRPDR
jgi:hypothetical protein